MSISWVKIFVVISFLGLMACGQGKNAAVNQTPSQSQNGSVVSEQPRGQTIAKKSHHKKHHVGTNKNPTEPVASVPVSAPAPKVQEAPHTSVVVPPPQVQIVQNPVLGLGSQGRDVNGLLDQGYTSAIFEARVCSITGEFSDHSKCFIVFKDGHSEWVNPNNRNLILPFIAELQAANDSKSTTKPKKKKHHHFLFF